MRHPVNRRSLLRWTLAMPGALVGFASASRPVEAAGPCRPTEPDVEGPFHIPGAVIARAAERGDRLRIHGVVFGPDCRTALPGALLDVWQADADGRYHDEGENYRLRGQILTGSRGEYELETIRPGSYDMGGGLRPAHIHFVISHPAHEAVTTQLYFRGDPNLGPHDACGGDCRSGDPHRIIGLEGAGRG